MSAVAAARDDLEKSVEEYLQCKSVISKSVDSAVAVCEETLRLLRQEFEDAIKGLNKSHTIWRCRSEENGIETSSDIYSTSWLECEWEESFALDDEVEALIYAYSTQIMDKTGDGILTCDKYTGSSTMSPSTNVILTSNGPVSASGVSATVSATSDGPVLASDASATVFATSDGPVLASDTFVTIAATSDGPVLASDASATVSATSDGPVMASDIYYTVAATSDGPVLAWDPSATVSATSNGPVLASPCSKKLFMTYHGPIVTSDSLNDMVSDGVDISNAGYPDSTSMLESSVHVATVNGTAEVALKSVASTEDITNSPRVVVPAALVKLPSVVKPPAVCFLLGYGCMEIKVFPKLFHKCFRTCSGECDGLSLSFGQVSCIYC